MTTEQTRDQVSAQRRQQTDFELDAVNQELRGENVELHNRLAEALEEVERLQADFDRITTGLSGIEPPRSREQIEREHVYHMQEMFAEDGDAS